jgi:tripartite-type tricarboxylate transporter receptor subunit TctC
MAEAGLPDYRAETWYGLVAPAGIPAPIVKRLNEAVRIVLASPDIKANLASQGFELVPSTPDEFFGQIRHDYNKWSALIKDAGIKLSN